MEITTSLFSLNEKGLAISSLSLEGKGWGVEITTSLFSLNEKGLAISSLSLEGKGWGMATPPFCLLGKGLAT